ncbi:proteinaceous RNase P 1, chloroplastic/mitochondrial-like isoform X2 [Ananas comosus]|uniref:ribonuclease P n=1 Tax=Ananas comosus TaxID=4615 RepID=A0A6P5F0D4_ANACO|nr:proteinaceous RNase P 1, chloroplastic/mitochondrial-like isoform X2 [Ananas comosus]
MSSAPLQRELPFSFSDHRPYHALFKAPSFPNLFSLPRFKVLLPFPALRLRASNVTEGIAPKEETHERRAENGAVVGREEIVEFKGRKQRKGLKGRSFRQFREMGSSGLSSSEDGLVGGEEIAGFRGRKQMKELKDRSFRRFREIGSSGFSSSEDGFAGSEEMLEFGGRKHRKELKDRGFRRNSAMGSSRLPYLRPGRKMAGETLKKAVALSEIDEKTEEEVVKKASKKAKLSPAAIELRVGLDMCSKKGDVVGAISLYDSAIRDGIRMEQYHYNVLLYLCSSAAIGVVHPAKSGSGSSGSNSSSSSTYDRTVSNSQFDDNFNLEFGRNVSSDEQCNRKDDITISDDVKDYARSRGFEIFEKMCLDEVPMSEAALTSVARMALSMANGDLAFEIVKHMKELGINPRLRSYGPALVAFCNNGDVDKAFEVEAHMEESGVQPEESELEALLRASVAARRGDKVYYVLHKLRTNVRQVSLTVANLIEEWFRCSTASKVGKRKWDASVVAKAIENGGGGWHGLGWLGSGRWNVARTRVDGDGLCLACGEKLVTIDLDPIETENFALSVASIACKRERNSSFEKFQKWLDYYGPFEAVVDAANVGVFSQKRFLLTKVNAVVNAIRQKFPSKKWPLIIVHNKRLSGDKMDEPFNSKLIEKWKNADAIYATPTGSNDDWYWLYAAIKCKSLIITNDEMRDHTFQLLGNDFFPRWKERHQVRFSFQDGSFEFQMPPPCSVVVQESAKGHWHIPVLMANEPERERTWLCVTRANSQSELKESSGPPKASQS